VINGGLSAEAAVNGSPVSCMTGCAGSPITYLRERR
jgi:hypothetical protein